MKTKGHDTSLDHHGRALPHDVVQRLRKLEALEAYGVDNWEGYDDAVGSLRDDDGLSNT